MVKFDCHNQKLVKCSDVLCNGVIHWGWQHRASSWRSRSGCLRTYRDAWNHMKSTCHLKPHEATCQMTSDDHVELKLPHSPLPVLPIHVNWFFHVFSSLIPANWSGFSNPHFYRGVAYRFSCRLDDRLLLSPCIGNGLVQDQGNIFGEVAGILCFVMLCYVM